MVRHSFIFGYFCFSLAGSFGAGPVIESLPRIPATSAEDSLARFKVKDGFALQLAAAEPEVVDPIAMAFDEFGRLFVVEMRDYSERRDERLGRIRLLEDGDGDGYFEKSMIYAEGLPWPTAVTCYKGGIFVGSTPDIFYFKDTNGDGRADIRQQIFTGFGNTQTRLNVQQLLNSLQWGLDNRIHGAAGANGGRVTTIGKTHAPINLQNSDFSFNPATLEMRLENGGGQFGMSFDTRGRKFICSNSSHIRMQIFERWWRDSNPFYNPPAPVVDIPADGPAAEVFRISPDEPWRVIRTEWRVKGLVAGPIEGGGRASGYFTAATGITIYKGDAFGKEFVNDAFIADCGSNLIHRKKLHPKGTELVAKRPVGEEKVEFAASPDNWFRPVAFANAPDGNLYVADMYRETIEHPWSLPPNLKKHVDLNSGNDRGRIYRMARVEFKPAKRELPDRKNPAGLIKFLDHPNGWHRETAARLIFEEGNARFQPALRQAFATTKIPEGRIRILYLLHGNKWLQEEDLRKALRDEDPGVREHTLKLVSHAKFLQVSIAKDEDARVRMQAGLTAAKAGASTELLISLAMANPQDRWVDEAILIAAKNQPLDLALGLIEAKEERLAARVCGIAAQTSTTGEINEFLRGQSTNLALAAYMAEGLRKRDVRFGSLEVGSQILDFAKVAALSGPLPRRLNAILLLRELPFGQAAPLLKGLLADEGSIQGRAILALSNFQEAQVGGILIEAWESLLPASKQQALEVLCRREAWALNLLNSDLATYLTAAQRRALLNFPAASVKQRAAQIFARDIKPPDFAQALKLRGDARNGGGIFAERCASCHKTGQTGFNLGPDLLSVRSNGKEALLRAIAQPGLEVSPAYIQYNVTTKDNEVFTGIIADQNNSGVTLKGANGWQETLPSSKIASLKSSRQSMMPEGLLDGLTQQQIADLLDFVMTSN